MEMSELNIALALKHAKYDNEFTIRKNRFNIIIGSPGLETSGRWEITKKSWCQKAYNLVWKFIAMDINIPEIVIFIMMK